MGTPLYRKASSRSKSHATAARMAIRGSSGTGSAARRDPRNVPQPSYSAPTCFAQRACASASVLPMAILTAPQTNSAQTRAGIARGPQVSTVFAGEYNDYLLRACVEGLRPASPAAIRPRRHCAGTGRFFHSRSTILPGPAANPFLRATLSPVDDASGDNDIPRRVEEGLCEPDAFAPYAGPRNRPARTKWERNNPRGAPLFWKNGRSRGRNAARFQEDATSGTHRSHTPNAPSILFSLSRPSAYSRATPFEHPLIFPPARDCPGKCRSPFGNETRDWVGARLGIRRHDRDEAWNERTRPALLRSMLAAGISSMSARSSCPVRGNRPHSGRKPDWEIDGPTRSIPACCAAVRDWNGGSL